MKFDKKPLDIEEQIHRLQSRGLQIPNENRAKAILASISYYRLSAYWYTFLCLPTSDHKFKPGADFEQVYDTYKFDRKLRLLLFDQIERLEIALRTQIIYNYCHDHGNNWYENKDLFRKPSFCFKFNEILQKEMKRTSEVFIRHYQKKYTEPENPPAWMVLELASFGQLSLLYKNLKTNNAKKAISKHFGLHETVLTSWLETISFVRNCCAHHTRLWNRKLPVPAIWPQKVKDWLVFEPENRKKNRLYPAISALAFMLGQLATHDSFPRKMQELTNEYPNIPLDYMGFTPQWKDEKIWKSSI